MRVFIKVKPNSRVEEVTQDNEEYLVKVKEPPRDGRANIAVIRLLAKYFKVSPSSVRIVSGSASRNKIIEIT